ncbi:MAG: response regulator [bacterium]|nr:response regulator [bacterium]
MTEVKNILVVDDDDVIRLSCELTLKAEGMVVDSAENGRVGVEMLKKKKYDLILLDLMMPEMQGTEFLDFVSSYDESIIVIVITGFATIESAVETLKKGAYDYLPKPFTPEELRKVVRKGLERRKLLLEREQFQHEREENLERIAAEQSRLSTIINCMSEGLIAVDKDARLLLNNAVASNLLELKKSCRIGDHVRGILNNDELENWIIETLDKKKYPARPALREIVFDAEKQKIYSVTLAPIKEKKKDVSGLVLVLTDISEERKLARMKAEFQQLVAVVAHELKAPINTIEGYLDLIIKGYLKEKPEKELEYLTRSRDKAEKLRNLIQDLLSLTSIESGKLTQQMAPVDISKLLLDNSAFMENEAQKKQLKVSHDIPEQLPLILGDKNALTYLFSNLMSNAIKYNKDGGEVTIKAAIQDNYLIISFIDTGYGIAEEDLQKIFQEFFRSKNKAFEKIPGTGLGLSIARRIAELHNGFIKVQSKLNRGSCFDVYLPKINT